MIRVTEVAVRCDRGSACLDRQRRNGQLVGFGTVVLAASISEARRKTRQRGWRRREGQDLCPDCAGA